MNTNIKNTVIAADAEAQYDEKAKNLLSNKIILAHILVKIVDEFRGMNPKDVVPYIEGDVFVSMVPVEPGLTNTVIMASVDGKKGGQRIVGMNTENLEVGEGLVRFDIIFYVSRLISSQKERDFIKMNYDDIRRVYSIWICMNMDENSMAHVHLVKDNLIGSYTWKGGLDLLNIVLIGIANELPEHDEKYELHRLLSTLFSMEMSVDEKLEIIETEYNIPVNDKLRKDVSEMCNLSQGIREKGEAEKEKKIILNMHKNNFTLEQIALATSKSVEEVRAIIEKRGLSLV